MSALVAGVLVFELARARGAGQSSLARRAVWIVYLAPSAFVLVMGYAEATLMTASLVALLALRSRRWWIAAVAGFVAGLTRPVGVLLVVPALRRGVARARRASPASRSPARRGRDRRARASARSRTSLWAEHRSGDFLYPLRVQQVSTSRGGWIDPVPRGVARRARGGRRRPPERRASTS